MVAHSGNLMLVIGGAALVAWYGFSRLSNARESRRFPSLVAGSDQYSRIARAALAAEFRADQAAEEDPLQGAGGCVYCPCGSERAPAGVLYCSCGREMSEEPPEADARQGEVANEDLVCVYVANDSWRAALLRNYLRDHTIPCTCTVGETANNGFDYTPAGEVPLYVPATRAARAQRLLKKPLWKA